MGCHLENAEVLRYGCYALEHLSCSGYYGLTSDKNAFETAKGGIHTILTLNRMDSDVQRCGCRVLAHLVKRRCSTITNATAQLGLHLVLTAMQNHPASSDNIHGHASYFLANFAARQRFSRKNEKHIIEAGGVYSILTTMRRYNCEVSIQRRGLVSLHCVAFLPNGRARISFEGGIGVTLATMRRFQSHEGIQRRGSLLLRTLGVLDSFNRAKILCEGGVGVLVDAMREFPSSLKMQRCCLTTLYRLGFCNYPCFAFVSEGGIPVLVNVIREQADDKRIVFSCWVKFCFTSPIAVGTMWPSWTQLGLSMRSKWLCMPTHERQCFDGSGHVS